MKFSHLFTLFAASALLSGCSSLENPFANLFHTGHDARVYNSQTGQFEWPEERKRPQPRKAHEVAAALAATPAPPGRGDGRYFDAQKNEWIDPKPERTAAFVSRQKNPATPPAVASTAPSPHPAAAPTPPPARATGYYNTSTGKIEWQNGAVASAAPTPAPARHKRWWWPF